MASHRTGRSSSSTLNAQCEENFNREGDNDHYNMSFFFDADGYGAREFLLQVSGGNHTMTQQEMDKMIVSWMQFSRCICEE